MKTKTSTKQDVKYTLQCITKGNIKMKNENTTVTLTLTVEELDLIRHATWSLEKEIENDMEEWNDKHDSYKEDSYWIRRNDIQKNMYFDSKALRSKVIKANSDSFLTFESRQAFEKENGLEAGDLCSRYANNS
jgi:hypothetical protein